MKKGIIVDDAAVMRMRLKDILAAKYEIEAEAEKGTRAMEEDSIHRPDFVTMDITTAEMNGREAPGWPQGSLISKSGQGVFRKGRMNLPKEYSLKKFLYVLLAGLIFSCSEPQVSTIAGSGKVGKADGPALQASFDFIKNITVDNAGNIYIADYNNHKPRDRSGYNHRIRKVDTTGIVSTLAGSTAGYEDAQGEKAKFFGIYDLACDPVGNILVADYQNHRIRKVTPAGLVTTIAGAGIPGEADGPALQATFNGPAALAMSTQGILYIWDSSSRKIRKMTPEGQVSTLAGSGLSGAENGPGENASFTDIKGLTVDSQGNLFGVDFRTSLVRKITPEGSVSTYAGSVPGYQDGAAAQARFHKPSGIAADKLGNLYISEKGNNLIRKISPDGWVTTVAGSGNFSDKDGPVSQATFNDPAHLAMDPLGNLIILDSLNNKVRKITF